VSVPEIEPSNATTVYLAEYRCTGQPTSVYRTCRVYSEKPVHLTLLTHY
jgi:hypothetical protein